MCISNEYNGSILWSLKGLAVFHCKTQFTKAFKFNLNIQKCVKGISAPKHQPINYIHVYWSTICFLTLSIGAHSVDDCQNSQAKIIS